jgi:hypothetical protein
MDNEGLRMMENAKRVYVNPTFTFIDNLRKQEQFFIKSPYPTINDSVCHIKFNDDWDFEFGDGQIKGGAGYQPADFQHDSYGYAMPFMLINHRQAFAVPDGLGSMVYAIGSTGKVTGTFIELLNREGYSPRLIRFVFQTDNPQLRLSDAYLSQGFKDERAFYASGLMDFMVNDHPIRLINCRREEKHYLFIDSLIPIIYADFFQIIRSFIVANALCSGILLRSKVLALFSEDEDFEKITHHSFVRFAKSKSGLTVLRPTDLGQLDQNIPQEHRRVNPEVLGKMISTALTNPEFFRALSIIGESSDTAIEVRTATYCVALETLRNFIINNDINYTKPIKTKETAKKIKIAFKQIINDLDPEEFNDLNSILKKIENINQYGNTEGFFRIFELHNINLSTVYLETIKKRNDFLHGRIPFEVVDDNENRELVIVLYRLHLLLSALILRMSGYQGYFANNIRWKYRDLADEPVFVSFSSLGELHYPPK